MAHARNKLTTVKINAAIRAGKPVTLGDGGGLALRIKAKNAAAWLYRYFDGKAHEVGLGPWPDRTLESARRKAQELREQRLDGVDPLAAKAAQRAAEAQERAKAITFEKATRDYYAGERSKWSPGHAKDWLDSLEQYAFRVFGSKPVGAIVTEDVLRVVRPHWQTKHTTISRVRQRIEAVLAYATAHQLRNGDNPARWEGHLEHMGLGAPRNGVKHHDAMPLDELPTLIAKLRADDTVAARALEFLILTAARSGEVRFATWNEFDLEARLWIIPGERMKAKREHRVPLSDRAVAILEALPGANEREGLVFPGYGDTALGKNTLPNVLDRLGAKAGVTVHGFRSTFKDWAVEKTNYPTECAEIALAHTVGSAVERAYRRGDMMQKRREMMADWSKACGGSNART